MKAILISHERMVRGSDQRRYTLLLMPKAFTAFRVAPELLDAMREIKARDGVPMSVQVDFALRAWLQGRGVRLQSGAKRRPTRKRKQVAR